MPGRLAFKQLEQLIRKGEVDTVLTVFPDTFGRLMGKRVVGSYFLDHVADEGAHACIYLFTVDRSEEHTSELQSRPHLVCRLLLEKKKKRSPALPDEEYY